MSFSLYGGRAIFALYVKKMTNRPEAKHIHRPGRVMGYFDFSVLASSSLRGLPPSLPLARELAVLRRLFARPRVRLD